MFFKTKNLFNKTLFSFLFHFKDRLIYLKMYNLDQFTNSFSYPNMG